MECKNCIHEKVCPHLRNEDAERCKVYADKNDYIHIKRYDGTIFLIAMAKVFECSTDELCGEAMICQKREH